jgi:outer membrane protein assembly factor BamB
MQHKIVTCFLLCILTISISVSVVSADDWPQFHHDADHTGYTTSIGPLTNSTLWNFTTVIPVESSPVVANGHVYVACSNESVYDEPISPYVVYCLNNASGAQVWNFTASGLVSTPAVANGYVYLGSTYSASSPDGYVYCLNATSGVQM